MRRDMATLATAVLIVAALVGTAVAASWALQRIAGVGAVALQRTERRELLRMLDTERAFSRELLTALDRPMLCPFCGEALRRPLIPRPSDRPAPMDRMPIARPVRQGESQNRHDERPESM